MFELFPNLYISRQYVIQTFSYQFIKFAANLITWRRSCSFAEYWKHFMARLNGVYVLWFRGKWTNLDEIWDTLSTLFAAGPGRFWVPYGTETREREEIFCQVNNARFTDFQSAKFHEICTQHVDLYRDESFRNEFLKIFLYGVVFSKKATFLQWLRLQSPITP